MKEIFALVDCNNFFASCERCFNPKLIGKPIVILSNNDGCVISRSEEAKALGVPMGAPIHKYKDLIKDKNIYALSSNFALYGDMSNRVMKIISKYTPEQEIYSIDESFLKLSSLKIENYHFYCRKIVEEVKNSLGIPISIGVAATKTLAKLGNRFAKKNYESSGGVSVLTSNNIDHYLENLSVIEIWGIGYRMAKKLNIAGIYTALDFKTTNSTWIRNNLSVLGSRIQMELSEVACFEMLDISEPKKGILSSRSFRNPVSKVEDMREAVSTYTTRAAEKLREEHSLASVLTVSIVTNFHKEELPQYSNHYSIKLGLPTDYTPDLISAALQGLEKIYRDGYLYKKAYIYLSTLVPREYYQYDLTQQNIEKKHSLMLATDVVNRKMGHDTISFASQGTIQSWRMKQENTSPAYTQKWDELVRVK